MSTYTIYLGAHPIACVSGSEYAHEVYRKTVELAEVLGETASLYLDETGEDVAAYEG